MTDLILIFRFWIFACLFGMVMLAVLYLRQRKLSTLAFVLWGVLALVVPVIGPFLVIAARPGTARQSP
ncbi:MAG: hypothetical protein P8046_00350 [Anaerolineales bacterium]|jgi:hypothetical protein